MWRIKVNYTKIGNTYNIGQIWINRGIVDKIIVLFNFNNKQLVLVHWA